MVKKESYDLYRFGKREVELRRIMPQWKNSKVGDIAKIQCGRKILFKRIVKIHKGSLARIFQKIYYKRIFPEACTIFEAVQVTKRLYKETSEFMAFQLEDFK